MLHPAEIIGVKSLLNSVYENTGSSVSLHATHNAAVDGPMPMHHVHLTDLNAIGTGTLTIFSATSSQH
jgi:hypothetical protein